MAFMSLNHPGPVLATAFVREPACIVTGCEDGMLRVWDDSAFVVLQELASHTRAVFAVAAVDGVLLCSGGGDGAVVLHVVRKPEAAPSGGAAATEAAESSIGEPFKAVARINLGAGSVHCLTAALLATEPIPPVEPIGGSGKLVSWSGTGHRHRVAVFAGCQNTRIYRLEIELEITTATDTAADSMQVTSSVASVLSVAEYTGSRGIAYALQLVVPPPHSALLAQHRWQAASKPKPAAAAAATATADAGAGSVACLLVGCGDGVIRVYDAGLEALAADTSASGGQGTTSVSGAKRPRPASSFGLAGVSWSGRAARRLAPFSAGGRGVPAGATGTRGGREPTSYRLKDIVTTTDDSAGPVVTGSVVAPAAAAAPAGPPLLPLASVGPLAAFVAVPTDASVIGLPGATGKGAAAPAAAAAVGSVNHGSKVVMEHADDDGWLGSASGGHDDGRPLSKRPRLVAAISASSSASSAAASPLRTAPAASASSSSSSSSSSSAAAAPPMSLLFGGGGSSFSASSAATGTAAGGGSHALPGGCGAVYALATHGKEMYAGCQDGSIRVFDLLSGHMKYRLSGHGGGVTSLCILSAGLDDASASGGSGGGLYHQHLHHHDDHHQRHHHHAGSTAPTPLAGVAASLASAARPAVLCSGSADGSVRCWSLRTYMCTQVIVASADTSGSSGPGLPPSSAGVALQGLGAGVGTPGQDGSVAASSSVSASAPGAPASTILALASRGHVFVSACSDGVVRAYDSLSSSSAPATMPLAPLAGVGAFASGVPSAPASQHAALPAHTPGSASAPPKPRSVFETLQTILHWEQQKREQVQQQQQIQRTAPLGLLPAPHIGVLASLPSASCLFSLLAATAGSSSSTASPAGAATTSGAGDAGGSPIFSGIGTGISLDQATTPTAAAQPVASGVATDTSPASVMNQQAMAAAAAADMVSAGVGHPASPLATTGAGAVTPASATPPAATSGLVGGTTLAAAGTAAASSSLPWHTPSDLSPYVALQGGAAGAALPLTQDALLACLRELIAIPSVSLDPSTSAPVPVGGSTGPASGAGSGGGGATGGGVASGSSAIGGVHAGSVGASPDAASEADCAAHMCGHHHHHHGRGGHHHQHPRHAPAGTASGGTRDVQACWRAAQYVHDLLVRIGAECRLVQGVPGSNPLVLGRLGGWEEGVPTILLQATYDVQPAGDASAWDSPPFHLTGRDGYLYARGATDNKGPLMAMIFAVARCWELMRRMEAAAASTGSASGAGGSHRPGRVAFVFVVEGEGENGSQGFREAVLRNLEWLSHTNLIVNCNNTWIGENTPCLTYGMRGLVKVRVEVEGGKTDLHSGLDGGVSHEPLQDLCALLGGLTDPHTGRIAIPGIYSSLAPLHADELALYRAISDFGIDSFMDARGLPGVFASAASTLVPGSAATAGAAGGAPARTTDSSGDEAMRGGATAAVASGPLIPLAAAHGADPVDTCADALASGHPLQPAAIDVCNDIATGAASHTDAPAAATAASAGVATSSFTGSSGTGSGVEEEVDVQSAVLLRRWREPALSVHGVACSAANDSIIPCKAVGFVSIRTVPSMSSAETFTALADHLKRVFAARRSVNTLRVSMTAHASWWLQDPESPAFQAAARAIRRHWGRWPIFVREGGTVRVTTFLEKTLGAPAIHIPIGQSSDAPHLPNERIRLLNLVNGLRVLESLFLEIAGIQPPEALAGAAGATGGGGR